MDEEFRAVAQQMFALYDEKRYREAYELVTEAETRYPDGFRRTSFWRACLASRMDEPDLAIVILEDGLEAGHWYWPWQLMKDSDLEPLWDRDDYKPIVRTSAERQDAARAAAGPPEMLVLEPKADLRGLLLAFHGNYSSAEGSIEYWRPATEWGWVVALPQSGQEDLPGDYVWNDRAWMLDELAQHRSALENQFGGLPDATVVGGFSMGGWWSIWLTLTGEFPSRGFVAVSAYIQNVEDVGPLVQQAQNRRVAGYAIVGENDRGAYESALELQSEMKALGLGCQIESHAEMGHEYPDPFAPSLRTALEHLNPG